MKTITLNFIFYFVLLSFTIHAQTIKVIDSKTHDPIIGAVFSDTTKTNYIISDNFGTVNLSNLDTKSNIIIIQHNYYQEITINKDTIKKDTIVITLDEITFQLDKFTVVANKWEQNSSEVPFSIQSINPKTNRLYFPQTTADMLGASGKVFIQKSQMGGGSPMIRGFAANSVLIVVDGVRLNNAIFRSGNLQNSLNIDPNSMGHTEIIFGPGSVTYGSDALGGVMDFHTKEPSFSNSGKLEKEIDGFYQGASANLEKTISIGLDLKWKKISSHSQFLSSSFSNLHAGKKHFGNYTEFGKRKFFVNTNDNALDSMVAIEETNLMLPSLYKILNLNQKIKYQPNKNIDFTYSLIYSTTSNIPRYDRLTQWKDNHLKYAEWYYGPQNWQMHNLRIRLFKPTKIYDSGKLILAYQRFEESRNDRKYRDSIFRHRTETVDLYTTNIDFTKKINNNKFIYYGIDLGFNNVNSKAFAQNIANQKIIKIQTRYPDIFNYYLNSGIYANFKYKYNKNLNILGGIRYSLVYLNSKFDNSNNNLPFNTLTLLNQAPNGSLGIAWLPSNNSQLNFNISTGFRAPNLDDVAKVFDSEPSSVVVPNQNLHPEYVYSTELSFAKSLGEFGQINIAVFTSYIDNIIVRKDFSFNGLDSIIYDGTLSKVQAMQNTSFAKIYGSTIDLKIKLTRNINISSNYNITRGYDSDNNSLRHVPPDFGKTTIIFKNKLLIFSFYSMYSSGISFDKLAPSEQAKTYIYSPDGATPWFTINCTAEIKIYKQIHLNIGIQNILDRFYIPYSSGIAAPGRNIILGIQLYPL